MRFPALLFVALAIALPAAAVAQTPTPPPPQPTPPPGWHAPDEDEPPAPAPEPAATPDPDLRAVDTLPPEMTRRRPQGFGEPGFAPTLGVAAAFRSVENRSSLSTASIDLWLGVRFHPMVTAAGPFMAMGAEVNFREIPALDPIVAEGGDRTYTEVVPEMRLGFAHLRRPHNEYINTLFPNVELYGIAGWRIANRYNGNALRVGAGVSVPVMMALSAAAGYPVPSMLEVTMDTAFNGTEEYAFRFGWHF